MTEHDADLVGEIASLHADLNWQRDRRVAALDDLAESRRQCHALEATAADLRELCAGLADLLESSANHIEANPHAGDLTLLAMRQMAEKAREAIA